MAASQVFLQKTLFAPYHCAPTKLGFSSSLVSSCAVSTLGSRNLPLISGVSSASISQRCSPLTAKPTFLVRADSNPDAAADNVDEIPEASDNVDEVPEAEQPTESDTEVEQPKPARKPRVKLGDIMGILSQKAIEASDEVRPTPDIRPGDVVEIKLEIPENKRRLSIYKGIVISKQNAGIHTTIRIRRIIAGTGVEIIFPIYSPNIKEIKVVTHRKVRRAKLYYLRDKLPRLSTFK